MKPLLEVSHLSITFRQKGGESVCEAVKDISFKLNRGEILGIVGESGSGKSVTALSLLGLLPRLGVVYSPHSSIRFEQKELMGAQDETLRQIRGGEIGFVFQEPMSSLNPLHRIGRQISESLVIHQYLKPEQAKARSLELLELVGIPDPLARYEAYPFELSGGQRQRVMIAMAIANNPKILIADEPTTALDVTIQAQIIDLLLQLRQKMNMAVIFISHDLRLVKKIADRVIVMHRGKIVESGTAKQIFEGPRDAYTKTLLSSSLSLKNINKSRGKLFMTASNLEVVYCLKKSFWGKKLRQLAALDKVNLEIYRNQTLGIVGESGSGKTTLGLCLARLIAFKGEVNLTQPCSDKDFRQKVQIVFQDPYNSLNPRLNVFQIVSEGLDVHFPKMSKSEKKDQVVQMLCETGLSEDDLYKYPHEFSGGQRQRIAIARVLILKPELIILDEPTSALDVTIQAQILDLLKKLQRKYKTSYVFISHDMAAVRAMSDRVAVMKSGKIIEYGSANTIFAHPEEKYTQELIKASLL